ncbi:MAG: hypothetical protein IH787_02540 [Nitrospirae bacterium]|nr:hypothetical protein [Nitrospirota bacterium]
MSTGAPEEHDEPAEAEAPASGSFAQAAKMALIVFAILPGKDERGRRKAEEKPRRRDTHRGMRQI